VKAALRDGIPASTVFLSSGRWLTLIDFFIEKFPNVPAQEWQRRFDAGEVFDVSQQPVKSSDVYRAEQRLFYFRHIDNEPSIPFSETILFEDDVLLVADKPHFLPVIPAGRFLRESLLVRLRNKTQCAELVPIHRIDRETAGLVVFCKQEKLRGAYQSLFARKQVQKTYLAIAAFNLTLEKEVVHRSRLQESAQFMRMQEVEGEPNSETMIRILERNEHLARYELQPITGKKHQLRVHMNALGAPILFDQIYPEFKASEQDSFDQSLQLLAYKIAFIDPLTHQQREFTSQRQLMPLDVLARNI
jgi:tRNA pseudouridine32 synthase / 23S rRNA pseudouridine746 synthase